MTLNLFPRVFHFPIKDSGNEVDMTPCDAYKKKHESSYAAAFDQIVRSQTPFWNRFIVHERNDVIEAQILQ